MHKLSVHVLFEHGEDHQPFGVAHIRDILPLSHPHNAKYIQLTYGRQYRPAEVVIVERLWRPDISLELAEELLDQVRSDHVCLVYSIDDNLLDLERFPVEARMVARFFCREADGIIVSTEPLQERLHALNQSIHVVPNAVDERLYTQNGARVAPGRGGDPRKVIGYMGTFTHDGDLMLLLQALRKYMQKHPDGLEFQLVGGVSNQATLKAFAGLPVRTLHVPRAEVPYPNFVGWMKTNLDWDLGLAPLEDNYFNRFKSDIKFLDYSALGIPGIYSRLPQYKRTIRHLETGYLAGNTPAEWSEALEVLMEDAPTRLRLASNAQTYVFSTRTLEHCAVSWREAIYSITNRS